MGLHKFEILPETLPLPRPLYLWARVESVDVVERPNDKSTPTAVSLDALACEDLRDLESLTPLEPKWLRHITLHFPRPDSRGGPAEFDSGYKEGDWLRLTLSIHAHGPLGFIEGPFPSLLPGEDTAASDHPVFFGRLAWIRRTEPHESRLLSDRCKCEVVDQLGPKSLSIISEVDGSTVRLPDLLVRVVDVGQASCNAIHSQHHLSRVVGYFDVGRPLWFQSKSWPTTPPSIPTPKNAFVVLSHWDYDHYSMALGFQKALLNLSWFAPAPQHPGPTVAALIKRLGRNLSLCSAGMHAINSNVRVYACTGPTNDKNQCGYAMQVQTTQGNILMAGDADYQYIPSPAKRDLKGLVISHHGGGNTGTPPTPSGPGNAVVSFGVPNKYHHPVAAQIKQHTAAGWVVVASNWAKHPDLAPMKRIAGATRRKDHWL